jgi:hypothetical protein
MNWTGVFTPGQKVRLRFIDAGAMTFFDLRIPDLPMTVVQADGQTVQPMRSTSSASVPEKRSTSSLRQRTAPTPCSARRWIAAATARNAYAALQDDRRRAAATAAAVVHDDRHGDGGARHGGTRLRRGWYRLKGHQGHSLATIEQEATAAQQVREAVHDGAAHGATSVGGGATSGAARECARPSWSRYTRARELRDRDDVAQPPRRSRFGIRPDIVTRARLRRLAQRDAAARSACARARSRIAHHRQHGGTCGRSVGKNTRRRARQFPFDTASASGSCW